LCHLAPIVDLTSVPTTLRPLLAIVLGCCWHGPRCLPCGSLAHLLTCSLAHLLTCSLAHLLASSLAHLLTCSLAHLPTCSLAHLLTYPLAHLLTCSLAHLQVSGNQYFSPNGNASVSCPGGLITIAQAQTKFNIELGSTAGPIPSDDKIIAWAKATLGM
jgi:hypothetical protein